MDENLIIKSYWEICGFNQEDINKFIEETSINNNERYLIKEHETVNHTENVADDILLKENVLGEEMNFQEILKCETTIKDVLLPSKMLKSSKISSTDILKLDCLFNKYFEMGKNNSNSTFTLDSQNDLNWEGAKELSAVWSKAGYHTGVVYGMLNGTHNEESVQMELSKLCL